MSGRRISRRNPAPPGLARDPGAPRTLGALVNAAAERWPEREALVFGERRWTFHALHEDIERAARALVRLGAGAGDRVALWLDNRPEWLHAFLAAASIGAIAVPVNSRLRAVDLAYVLRQSGASVLLLADRTGEHLRPTGVDYLGILREIVPEIDRPGPLASERFGDLRHVVVLGETIPAGTIAWRNLADGDPSDTAATREIVAGRQRAVTPDDVTLMLYTSGTTGTPKGALHTHAMTRTVTDGASRLGITPRDRLLLFLPLFHSMGLFTGPLLSLVSGASLVLMERFDAGRALALMAGERVTFFAGFDTHASDLLLHPSFGATDLRSVRVAFLPAGAPSVEAVARRMNRSGIPTVSGYGSTEVGTGVCYSFLDASEDERATGSGFPMPGYRLRVVDPETGAARPPGVPGELCVRGYGVTRGYHGKPAETAAAFDPDGWFHTGDLATLDADGHLRFLGRLKDMLKVGGENVDPAEVEAYLMAHPSVAQVKVVGVPDARLGEVPVACVLLRQATSATEEELIAFCRNRIASFKIPRRVVFVTGYPLTSTGKVQRFALRERVHAMLESEAAGAKMMR
jgi:fatty-acyl-CoA synthase